MKTSAASIAGEATKKIITTSSFTPRTSLGTCSCKDDWPINFPKSVSRPGEPTFLPRLASPWCINQLLGTRPEVVRPFLALSVSGSIKI